MNQINCDKEIWKVAQQHELEVWKAYNTDDDWNLWWMKKFGDYQFVKDMKFNSILEVGCGPVAKNIQYVLNSLEHKPSIIGVNDPLLDEYIKLQRPVSSFIESKNAKTYTCALEDLNTEIKYDCIVCINVIGHTSSLDKCMNTLFNSLNENGVLILGEDLTNEEDIKNAPVADIMHPVRFSFENMAPYIQKFNNIYLKTLQREEGRNPSSHYSTLLYVARKGGEKS